RATLGTTQKAALRGVVRQIPRRQIVGIEDTTDHDGAVRLATDEVDDHFVAHARQLDAAKSATSPRAGNPHPARAVLILLAIAVPMELHFDAAHLVGPDFF